MYTRVVAKVSGSRFLINLTFRHLINCTWAKSFAILNLFRRSQEKSPSTYWNMKMINTSDEIKWNFNLIAHCAVLRIRRTPKQSVNNRVLDHKILCERRTSLKIVKKSKTTQPVKFLGFTCQEKSQKIRKFWSLYQNKFSLIYQLFFVPNKLTIKTHRQILILIFRKPTFIVTTFSLQPVKNTTGCKRCGRN